MSTRRVEFAVESFTYFHLFRITSHTIVCHIADTKRSVGSLNVQHFILFRKIRPSNFNGKTFDFEAIFSPQVKLAFLGLSLTNGQFEMFKTELKEA